jgi:hypothetical protein
MQLVCCVLVFGVLVIGWCFVMVIFHLTRMIDLNIQYKYRDRTDQDGAVK